MATRTDRIETRVAPEENERIRFAADLEHTSVSSFVVQAAVEKADRVIAASAETIVPADYFDQLLAALDASPSLLAGLRRAAERRPEKPFGHG